MKETDLYGPVAAYLEGMGYTVKAEVKNCDVYAVLGDTAVVVELKKTLNLEVILQAIERQHLTDHVYIAVLKPNKPLKGKRWNGLFELLNRLRLGLLFVTLEPFPYVEAAANPEGANVLRRGKKSAARKEFDSRTGNFNLGGSTGQKLVTAYREACIEAACVLESHEALSLKEIREQVSSPEKVAGLLSGNHYGWFCRVEKGVYALTEKGREALRDYKELSDYYRKRHQNALLGETDENNH